MANATLIGLSAFVFIELLCQPFEVFGWWPETLRRIIFGTTAIIDYEEMKWWQLMFYKPLADCGKCLAGWLSFAYCLTHQILDPFKLIIFCCAAMFTAWLLEQLKPRIEQ